MMPQRKEGEKAAAKPARGLPLFDPDLLAAKMAGASGRDWRVLMHLATFADWGNGQGARPASSTLAGDLALDKSNVCKTLRRLAGRGVIVAMAPATPRRPASWSFSAVVRPSRPPRSSSAPPPGLSGSFTGGQKRGGGSGRPGFDIPQLSADEKRREAAERLHSIKVRYQAHKVKCKEPRCRDCAGYERDIAAREGRS